MNPFNELDHDTKAAWLERFEQQNQSAKKFCDLHELNYHQFLAWKRQQQTSDAEQFIEFDISSPPISNSQPVVAELELGNNLVLRIFKTA